MRSRLQVLRCPVCLEAFSTVPGYSVYEGHLRIHRESALFKQIDKVCSVCCKLFRAAEDWKEHRELEHPEGNIAQIEGNKVMCHICGIGVPER